MISMKQIRDLVRRARDYSEAELCVAVHPECIATPILPPLGFKVDGEYVEVHLDEKCPRGKVYVFDLAKIEDGGDIWAN